MRYPALLLAAAAIAFPATASAESKVCPSKSVTESTLVKNVSCSKAKKVLADFFEDGKAKGWNCNQKQYEGGSKTTCKKGTKKIVYSVAD